jgi:hypothetical protein
MKEILTFEKFRRTLHQKIKEKYFSPAIQGFLTELEKTYYSFFLPYERAKIYFVQKGVISMP